MPISEATKYPMNPPTKKYLQEAEGLLPTEEDTQTIPDTFLFLPKGAAW